MRTETIIDIPTEFLIEIEIFDENTIDVTLATDISFFSLITFTNLATGPASKLTIF